MTKVFFSFTSTGSQNWKF